MDTNELLLMLRRTSGTILNFTGGALPSDASFQRSTSGTYVGSDRLLKTASTDEPRFDFDPSTGASLGLLIEESRTNLLEASQDFTSVFWNKVGSPTITCNFADAPDGTASLCKFTRTTTGVSYIQNTTTKPASSQPYVFSFWTKKGSVGETVAARLEGTYPNRADVSFNTTTGVAATPQVFGSGFTGAEASIEEYPNGLYRCTLSVTGTDTATNVNTLLSCNSIGSDQVDVTDSVANSEAFFWGAQLEQAPFKSSYISTVDSAVTRGDDLLTVPVNALPTKGTLFVDLTLTGEPIADFPEFFEASGGVDQFLFAYFNAPASGKLFFNLQDGSAVFDFDTFLTPPSDGVYKIALSYESGSYRAGVNGTQYDVSNTTTVIPVQNVALASTGAAGVLSCHIRSFRHWNKTLSNLELVNLTVV